MLPAGRRVWMVLAISCCLCVYVCVYHKPVLCQNGCTDQAVFLHRGRLSSTYPTVCYKEFLVSPKIGRYFSLERFSRLWTLKKFAMICGLLQCCQQSTDDSCLFVMLTIHICNTAQFVWYSGLCGFVCVNSWDSSMLLAVFRSLLTEPLYSLLVHCSTGRNSCWTCILKLNCQQQYYCQ